MKKRKPDGYYIDCETGQIKPYYFCRDKPTGEITDFWFSPEFFDLTDEKTRRNLFNKTLK